MVNSTSEITTSIINTINTIIDKMFSSIDNNAYEVLDDLIFIDSNLLEDKYFGKILGTSSSSGILLIANALIIGFLIYYGIKYLFSNFTYTRIENPVQFIFKIIIYAILMNSSFFIIEEVLDFVYNFCSAIRGLGKEILKEEICFANLIETINENLEIDKNSFDIFSMDGLIKGTVTISILNLILSYSFRYIVIKVFVIFSPFAFISLCLESTSWFFKSWYRNLFSLLFIQVIVSIVILIIFSITLTNANLLSKFIYIGGIYALIKANSIAKEFLIGSGVSTNIQNNFSFSKLLGK